MADPAKATDLFESKMIKQSDEEKHTITYLSKKGSRIELWDKHQVILMRGDEMIVLNTDTKVFAVSRLQIIGGRLTVRTAKPDERRPKMEMLDFEPKLFEIPTDFTRVPSIPRLLPRSCE